MSKATAENIVRLIALTGATHKELAKIAGVDRSAVSQWKSGKTEPRMGNLQKIADHYGISVENLINPNGMRYIYKGRDGRLHENSAARVRDAKLLLQNIDEMAAVSDLLSFYTYATQSSTGRRKLTSVDHELLDMFDEMNSEGQQLVLTFVAALAKSGVYNSPK